MIGSANFRSLYSFQQSAISRQLFETIPSSLIFDRLLDCAVDHLLPSAFLCALGGYINPIWVKSQKSKLRTRNQTR
jgi:hypothetical protein